MPSLRPSLHVVFATIAGLKPWNANTTVSALDESSPTSHCRHFVTTSSPPRSLEQVTLMPSASARCGSGMTKTLFSHPCPSQALAPMTLGLLRFGTPAEC